jgi:RND family efflux transporter MFP subunit
MITQRRLAMKNNTALRILVLVAAAALMSTFMVSCGAPASTGQADPPPSAPSVPDLTVPPPGSQATLEKWDSFSEEKKNEAWAGYLAENVTETVAAPVTKTAPPAAVVVGELTRAPIDLYYYGLGELKAGREQRVSPLVTGVVASLYVNEGDFVEPGDLLFSLDSNDLIRDIELVSDKWNAELELAQIRLNETLADYEALNSLYERDLISKSENDSARKSWEEAKIAYEKVRLAKTTELEKLQENLRTSLTVSPGRGYVSAISFNAGEQINSGDFIEIVDIENIVISIPVPENIITRVAIGNMVFAKQASAPSYSLEGEVTGRGIISDSNRSFEVIAQLDNPDERLLPGMLMEAQIRIAQLTPNFIIPKESLLSDGSEHFIFIIDKTAARRVPVTMGQSRGTLVQISGAINEGDLLVLQGQSYLREGAAVKIVETREYLPERREL